MEVYKFGGASVKDAAGIKNLSHIVKGNQDKKLLIVVSAMGKTTNKLEELTRAYISGSNEVDSLLEEVRYYHFSILNELFPDGNDRVFHDVENTFVEIDWILEDAPHEDPDFIYDQIVSIGELVSSKIVGAYLNFSGVPVKWVDARGLIQTDNTYREANVDWEKTGELISANLKPLLDTLPVITQGFIGGTSENYTTTLGREGSDYSAAVFAACLNAEAVTIWKDVPGVLNADPKVFAETSKYDRLSYTEALEMTYYGATVIHPKTIKPLQNAGIPLLVKPFLTPEEQGTTIGPQNAGLLIPAIIVKNDQALLSLTTRDFSFVTENHLVGIFGEFARLNIKINMTQISAISFSACFDYQENKFESLLNSFQKEYNVKFNRDLQLITVRHYNTALVQKLTDGKKVLLEQFSRNTAQLVIKAEN